MTAWPPKVKAFLWNPPGRVNQKRRTRAAIVAAARSILDRGETPTVAQVAEEAQMTRTTVYRYFPNQESLLVELSSSLGMDEAFAELLARPLDGATPQTRLLEVIDELMRYVAANEKLYRIAQRHYLDTWLAAERAGRTTPFRCEKGVACAGSQPRWHRCKTSCPKPNCGAWKQPSASSPAAGRTPSSATYVSSNLTKPSLSPTGPRKLC